MTVVCGEVWWLWCVVRCSVMGGEVWCLWCVMWCVVWWLWCVVWCSVSWGAMTVVCGEVWWLWCVVRYDDCGVWWGKMTVVCGEVWRLWCLVRCGGLVFQPKYCERNSLLMFAYAYVYLFVYLFVCFRGSQSGSLSLFTSRPLEVSRLPLIFLINWIYPKSKLWHFTSFLPWWVVFQQRLLLLKLFRIVILL